MKDHALEYYDRGWMPLPLRSSGSPEERKRPLLDRWRQYQHIRPPREEVERWWTEHPDANLALITGRVSGLVVLDFDGQVDDPVHVLEQAGLPADGPVVATGGGGFHAYFRHPGGDVANGVRVGQLGAVNLDVRGDGGYVVAPPSIHGSGRPYVWLQKGELPLWPDVAAKLASNAPRQTVSSVISGITEIEDLLDGVGEGGRNDAAAKVCGYWLRATDGNETAAWKAVKIWNTRNRPPLPERELETTFRSISRAFRTENPELSADKTPTRVFSASEWAQAVRDLPPRTGVKIAALPTLDAVDGLVPGDLIILAGRPGAGKSTCAWNIAAEAALDHNLQGTIFSTEMTMRDVARWMASYIHEKDVRSLTPEEWNSTIDRLSRSPLSICDKALLSVQTICEEVERRPGTKFVIIDHIQRIVSRNRDSRNQELEAIASRLKSLAKDQQCTVIALSQMNRQAEAEGHPGLRSLRDSGGLEQEADAVILLYSESRNPEENPLPVTFYLGKNRHGPLQRLTAQFHKTTKRFVVDSLFTRTDDINRQVEHERRTRLLSGDDDPW